MLMLTVSKHTSISGNHHEPFQGCRGAFICLSSTKDGMRSATIGTLMNVRLMGARATLGLLLLGVPTAVAAETSAADLLAKHKAYVGWESGDGSIKTIRKSIQIHDPSADNGDTDVVLEVIRRGLLFKQMRRLSGGKIEYQDGYTGRVFWGADLNGNLVTKKNGTAQLELAQTIVEDEGVTVVGGKLNGSAKIDGIDTSIVRVTPGDAAPFDVYIDPATGAFKRVVYFPDDKYERQTEEIASYTDVGKGKKIVGAYKDGPKRLIAVDHIRVNEPVTDAELHPPPKLTSWTFASSDPIPVEEILYSINGLENYGRAISVRVSIDGHEGRFLLDSGAPDTLVVGAFAATIDSPTIASTAYRTVGFPTQRAELKLVKEIKIGQNILHNVRVKVAPSPPFGPFDGIIGFAILADAIVDVDLNNKTLRILDPAKFDATVAKGAYAFDVDLSSFHAAVPALIDGRVKAEPFIDTGNYYGVVLAGALYDNNEVRAVPRSGPLGFPRINEIQVGPYRYQSVPTRFMSGFGHRGGLLGYDFLKHFNWTFDLPNSKIVLTPNGR